MRNIELGLIKKIIKKNYKKAPYGIYNYERVEGDKTYLMYSGTYFTLVISYEHGYYEIYNTSNSEYEELKKFYNTLGFLLESKGE